MFLVNNSTFASQGQPTMLVKISGATGKISCVYTIYQSTNSSEMITEKLERNNSDGAEVQQFYGINTFGEIGPYNLSIKVVTTDGVEKEYTPEERGNGNPQGNGTYILLA